MRTLELPVPTAAVIAFVPAVAMAQVIPISIGGLGVREGMLVLFLHSVRRPQRAGDRASVCSGTRACSLVSMLGAPAFAVGKRTRDRASRPQPPDGDHRHRVVAPTRTAALGGRRAAATAPSSTGGSRSSMCLRLLPRVLRGPERQQERPDGGVPQRAARSSARSTSLGIYHEATLQQLGAALQAAHHRGNYYYGSLHFVVTIGVAHRAVPQVVGRLPALAQHARRRRPGSRSSASSRLAAHAAALLGMPALHYGFVDTLDEVPDVLDVRLRRGEEDLEPVRGDAERALLLGAVVRVRARAAPQASGGASGSRRRCTRSLTVTVIVITANHYFLDAVGGFAILGIGYVVAQFLTRAGRARPRDRATRFARAPRERVDLDHVALATADTAPAMRFLTGVLGGTVLSGGHGVRLPAGAGARRRPHAAA